MVVAVLNAFDQAGLSECFTVIGTQALYAYETAANILIQSGALATQDVDLLRDARKMVQFHSALQQHDASVLKVLRSADASFNRMDEQEESAINDRGFMVDFLRRMATDQDPHPFRFPADEGGRHLAHPGATDGAVPQRTEVQPSGRVHERQDGADAHHLATGVRGVQAMAGWPGQPTGRQAPPSRAAGPAGSAVAGRRPADRVMPGSPAAGP